MVIATIETTEYNINEVDIKYSMCKSSGTASFLMDVAYRDDITTFNDVEISVDGEAIFTGFIEAIVESRFPHRLVIEATSQLIKAERTWFKEEYIANGKQEVRQWVDLFLGKAQITNRSVIVPYELVYEGHSWGFQTAEEALLNLAQIVDARMYPDRHGKVHFKRLKKSGIDHVITNYAEVNKLFSNKLCRNKVTVFGNGVTSIRYGDINPYVPSGAVRHVAISSSLITVGWTADYVADKILKTFNKPLEIYTYVIEGAPTMSLNEYLETPDDSGAITSLQHSIDEKGFTTTVTIGEVCPNFFGMDILEMKPFNYTAIYVQDRMEISYYVFEYQNRKLLFLKEVWGEQEDAFIWEEHIIATFPDVGSAYAYGHFGVVLAQNSGNVFLVMAHVKNVGQNVYRSEDYGETWELIHTFPETSTYAVWFDCTGSTFVALVETYPDAPTIVTSIDYGETWIETEVPLPTAMADLIGSWAFQESFFCMDEYGTIHIASHSWDWDPEESVIYTSSPDLGQTWTEPVSVLSASGDGSDYFRLGGVAAYGNHVCVGGVSSGEAPAEATFYMNVSHNGGFNWETQTTEAAEVGVGWDSTWFFSGAGIWMNKEAIFFIGSGEFYNAGNAGPYPYSAELGRYINQYCKADYYNAGSIVVSSTGVTTPDYEGGTDRRNFGTLGGNVAYGQVNLAWPLAITDVVPVNAITELREPPYGWHYSWIGVRKHVLGKNVDSPETVWTGANGPGPITDEDKYNVWWSFIYGGDYGLRMSSWRIEPE